MRRQHGCESKEGNDGRMGSVLSSQLSRELPLNDQSVGTKLWGPPNSEEAEEFLAYSSEYDRARCLMQFDHIAGAVGACIDTTHVIGPVRDAINARIKTRTPASFVRMGDGEGNVLFHEWGRYKVLSDYCLRKISKICFGSENVIRANFSLFSDILTEAIEDADFVGGPERRSIDAGFDRPLDEIDVRGVCGMRGMYSYMESGFDPARLKDKLWGATFYSRSMMPHYSRLLDGLPFVGVVSCYEKLAPALASQFNIARHSSIIIPMQASIARKMDAPNGHLEQYEDILQQIRPPYEGAVYIIAAGHLGKGYCSAIKKRGGIAIDVGSVADAWMGIRSRPGISNDFVDKWKLCGVAA
jgi:hypothetical protein